MTDNTRQEAVERAGPLLRDLLNGTRQDAERLIDASGLLAANNQLRQRLTEAEEMLEEMPPHCQN